MLDLHLHGNHQPCPTCKGTGRGEIMFHAQEFENADGRTFPTRNVHAICPGCAGHGRAEKLACCIVVDHGGQCLCLAADDTYSCAMLIFRKPDQQKVVV